MSNATCPNCGAAQIIGAKFCRQCGRLVGNANAASVTEATTRTLPTPAAFSAQPTDFLAPQPTSPAYLAPEQTPQSPLAYNTKSLEQRAQKRKVWLIGLMASLFLLSIIAFGIVKLTRSRIATPQPTTGTPELPPGSVTQPHVPPPPQPPQPPTAPTGSGPISRAYIYPGAETIMELKRAGGGLLQLRTKDSFDKALAWYTTKLKPDSIIKTPEEGQTAILKSDKLMAIINASDEGTNIMLKELDASDMEMEDEP
jgi:serine/threonine protein kinase